ncbi:restriction endonuclease subunit S [Pseudoduganella sp. UC29_71]|uniref:restriction endonuclease subunit S n=1 Tax=Pseudoduganella sp. UC29_71 TaxID=3350174 RepID=UPI00366E28A1
MKPYPSYKPSGVQWLGDVPSHWRVNRLKEICRLRPSNVDKLTVEGQVSVRLCNYVDVYKNERITSTIEFMDATATAEQIEKLSLKRGDVVVTKDSESPWDIAVPTVIAEDIPGLVCGYHLTKLDPVRAQGDYLAWGLRCYQVNLHFALSANGITRYGLGSSALADGNIPVPPSDEQQAIADYLYVETARIDTLIHEKDELIGLLKEWRQSVIAEYTSGASQSQPKKATGNVHMPWIPSDWSMVRLGKYARIGNGSTPLKDNASYWEGGTFPWLNSAVVNRDAVDEGSEYVTDVALRACHLPIVEAGALLVALTGQGKTRGQVTVLRIQATINQHLAYLALDDSRFDSNFLFWALTGMYAALRMVSDGQGGTKGALTCDDLARFEVPMPSLSAQREIAKAVSSETGKIDDLIAHTNDEIMLLKELRAATITDAVLGRVDVRTAPKQ